MEKKQRIQNVVNLDMRGATEASVAHIAKIDNVVNLLYSPESAPLMGRIRVASGLVRNQLCRSGGSLCRSRSTCIRQAACG